MYFFISTSFSGCIYLDVVFYHIRRYRLAIPFSCSDCTDFTPNPGGAEKFITILHTAQSAIILLKAHFNGKICPTISRHVCRTVRMKTSKMCNLITMLSQIEHRSILFCISFDVVAKTNHIVHFLKALGNVKLQKMRESQDILKSKLSNL